MQLRGKKEIYWDSQLLLPRATCWLPKADTVKLSGVHATLMGYPSL